MIELPLFPLNTVLFPNTPIHLHIFEERYKRMITVCIREKQAFGVVLIQRGFEALGPLAEPYLVGCTADIVDVRKLEGGRFNIAAIGGERFRIRLIDAENQPYLVGQVEPFPWQSGEPNRLSERASRLRQRLVRWLDLLPGVGAGQLSVDFRQLPDEPLKLGWVAAAVLQIDPHEKQVLLETAETDLLIEHLLEIYRREEALLRAMIVHQEQETGKPFSLN